MVWVMLLMVWVMLLHDGFDHYDDMLGHADDNAFALKVWDIKADDLGHDANGFSDFFDGLDYVLGRHADGLRSC